MLPFSHLCTLLAAWVVAAQAVTPMEKVTSLLEDLKKEVEEAAKDEAATYGKFACFCKDKTKVKGDSIMEEQDTIDSTIADIEAKTAEKKDKITKLGEEQTKMEEATMDLQKATETYQKDKAEYEATAADLTKAISSLNKALKALSESDKTFFLQLGNSMSQELQETLAMADAMSLLPTGKQQAVSAFLQGGSADPGAYKFHSDKIITIITDLQKEFKDKKKSVDEEWEKTDNAFQKLKKDLTETIDTCKEQIKQLGEDIDDLKEAIAKKKKELAEAEMALKDDSLYMKDLTMRCEEKAQIWDQRSSQRNDEVEALSKALGILKDTVEGLDSAVNKRAMLLQPKKPAAPAKAAPKVPAKPAPANVSKTPANASVPAVKKAAPSLLQISKSRAHAFLAKVSRVHSTSQERAAALLSREGARLNSKMLSFVARQATSDPFDKIKKLIQNLIERLLEESKQEATKKGFCDTEMGKAESTRDSKYTELNKLDAAIEQLEASEAKLTDEIDTLGDDIKELSDSLKKATDLRKDEKEDNLDTIKQAKEGAKAVGEALEVLKDFYKQAAKASFLQEHASPVDEDDPGASGEAYKGSQDSSKAILGLLETIKSDFERTDRKTEAAEKKALEEFVEFERSSKSDIAAKTTKKKLNTQDLASTKTAIKTSYEDLQDATDLLDSALKAIEDLKPTCIDTGMSYAERVKKREEEMDALNKALCILDTEGVESECK